MGRKNQDSDERQQDQSPHGIASFTVRSEYRSGMGFRSVSSDRNGRLYLGVPLGYCFVPVWIMYRKRIFLKV
jgi:hypothetical protein